MKKIIVFLALLLSPFISHAMSIVPGGIQIQVTYIEPTANSDGSALKDLGFTSVYYSTATNFKKVFDATATSPIGGGTITKTAIIPWPLGKEGNVKFYAVAVDTNSNVSIQSNLLTVKFDTLSPGAPRAIIISGNMLFFNFVEPFSKTNGDPLDDLASVNVYYNDTQSAALKLLGNFPATNPIGGGCQHLSFPLSTFKPGSTIRLYARFMDLSNNLSPFPQALGIKIPD